MPNGFFDAQTYIKIYLVCLVAIVVGSLLLGIGNRIRSDRFFSLRTLAEALLFSLGLLGAMAGTIGAGASAWAVGEITGHQTWIPFVLAMVAFGVLGGSLFSALFLSQKPKSPV